MFSFEGVGRRRWQHNPRSRSLAHGNMGDILSSYYTPVVVLNLNPRQCVSRARRYPGFDTYRIIWINNRLLFIDYFIILGPCLLKFCITLPSASPKFIPKAFGEDSLVKSEGWSRSNGNLRFMTSFRIPRSARSVLAIPPLIPDTFQRGRYLIKLINVTSTPRSDRSTYSALSRISRYFKKFV
jgi:hypothetical protein